MVRSAFTVGSQGTPDTPESLHSTVWAMPNPLRAIRVGSQTLPRDVVVLSVVAFFVAVGFGVIVPVLPVFARSFGVGNFAVGAVVSGFAFMRLVTAPGAPLLGRRLGERTVLGIGMLVVAASSVGAGLARTYVQLLVMRGVGGIGSAMFTVSAMTLLVRAVEPAMRGRASAMYGSGFLIGGMAGPAVGAIFASISLRAPFFFYAVTLAAAGAIGLFLLSAPVAPSPDSGDAAPRPTLPLRVALGDVRYRAALLTVFAQGWQSQGVRSTLVPVLVVVSFGLTPTWTAGVFALAAVVQTLAIAPAGHAVDVRGRRPSMVAAGLITGIGALATPFAPNIWVLAVILCVYGLGSALHSTAPTAVVGDVVGPAGGQPIAVFSMMGDVGAILGPLIAGAVSDALSPSRWAMPAAFAIGGVLLLAGAIYSTRMPRPDPPATAPPATP